MVYIETQDTGPKRSLATGAEPDGTASPVSDRAIGADHRRILVIKLGALGDFILALGPFAAIRARHPDAHITLLTSRAFAEMGRRCGYFDSIEVDPRPQWHQLADWWARRAWFRAGAFDYVYDLQTNDRTSLYFHLYWPGRAPAWSGIVPGCSHRDRDPERMKKHAFARVRDQLRQAGIEDIPLPDLSWMDGDITAFDLPQPPARYVVLVPGSAPHRPQKRWPGVKYGELAVRLNDAGIRPVIVGTANEAVVTRDIAAICPDAIDLTGKTSLFDLAPIGRGAYGAIGNDTGPMHFLAAAGAPSLVLFSDDSHPELSAPVGPSVTTLKRAKLPTLTSDEVMAALPFEI